MIDYKSAGLTEEDLKKYIMDGLRKKNRRKTMVTQSCR